MPNDANTDQPPAKKARFRSRTMGERRGAAIRNNPGLYREFRRTFTFDPRATDPATRAIRSAVASGESSTLVNLVGHVLVYGSAYEVYDCYGPFQETMMAGCAAQCLASEPDIRFMYDHDSLVMARTISGTLTVESDDVGVAFSAMVDVRQQLANDLVIAVERGDVTQCSVGFICLADAWSADYMERSIYAIEIVDISAVGIPASPSTDISVARSSKLGEARSRVAAIQERIGKVLSATNQSTLQEGLDALNAVHQADDTSLAELGEWIESVMTWAESLDGVSDWLQQIDAALDEAQQAFADVLDTANSDDDQDSGGVEEGDDDEVETVESDDEARSRQAQLLELSRARLRMAA